MLNIVISFKHSTFLLIKFIWNLWLYRVVFLISVNFLLSFYSRDMYPKCFFPYFRLAIFLPHLVLLRNLHGHLEQCIDLGVFCRCVLVWDEWWSWTRCLFTFLYPSAARLRCYATRTYNECVTRTTFALLVLPRNRAVWSASSLVPENRAVSWRVSWHCPSQEKIFHVIYSVNQDN